MLLAATDSKGVCSLLNPGDSTPGSEVMVEGVTKEPEKILEFEDFRKVNMTIDKNQKAIYNGKVLQAEKADVKSDLTVEKGAKIS
jgi:hypothetical protein